MRVEHKVEPFPHVIIEQFFTEEELPNIWRELQFLSIPGKFVPPAESGSAWNYDSNGNKVLFKNNSAIWLDDTYLNRNASDILKSTSKIFHPELTEECEKNHWFFRYLRHSNADNTLLSYYEDGGYYKPHPDVSTLTAVIHLFKEPKNFEGGELSFSEFDYDVGLVNNRCIIFPSVVLHSVSEIKMNEQMFCGGRYTISKFIKLK